MQGDQIKTKLIKTLEYITKISLLIIGFIVLVYRNNTLQDFFEYLFLSFFKDDKKILYSKISTFFYDNQKSFIHLFWSIFILLMLIKLIVFISNKDIKGNYKNEFSQYSLYTSFKKHLITFWQNFKKIDESNEVTEKSKLHKNLANYIEDSHDKAFVINGEWGTGKTHSVKSFIDEYFKYDKQKPIYIPCFGINTREQVEKLIKSSYENNDESLKSKFNSLIKSIPVFGEGLQDLLKPKYDFNSMKKGSVFIFDDFERICECYQDKNLLNLIKNFNLKFKKDKNFNNKNKEQESNLEFDLNNFVGTFLKLDLYKFNFNNFDKFNTVSGVISELIDNYNMRIVIICNRNILDPRMFNEIFHNKISSIVYEFKLEPNENKIENLINNTFKDVIIDEEKSNLIKEFLNNEKMNIISLWKYFRFDNLRFLNNIILSFIYVTNYLDLELINKNLLGDIFYSIFIMHINNSDVILKLKPELTQFDFANTLYDIIDNGSLKLNRFLNAEKNSSTTDDIVFLKKYAYVGDTISNYWYSGLKFSLPKIKNDLNYFCDLKKDHLVLKFYENENDIKSFNISEILTSVNCFRLEDLTNCLSKMLKIYRKKYLENFKLNEADLIVIINNISSPKCFVNNNYPINLDELFQSLNGSTNIIPVLINDFNLLKDFFTKLNDKHKYVEKINYEEYEEIYTRINDGNLSNPVYMIELFKAFLYCKENKEVNFKDTFTKIKHLICTYNFV